MGARALPILGEARAVLAQSPTVAVEPMGFFTDTTVCIGCKACEVACKEWNQLPARGDGGAHLEMSGLSYDNTVRLDGTTWRHVKFIEQFPEPYNGRWLMMSDVCKHCVQAPCLEVCPTGAIIRTEFDTVVHPVRHVQRVPGLHRGLPVRRDRHQPRVGHGAEVHALLRSHERGPRACVFEGLPHRLDPVRTNRRAAAARTAAGRATPGAG